MNYLANSNDNFLVTERSSNVKFPKHLVIVYLLNLVELSIIPVTHSIQYFYDVFHYRL